MADDTAPGNETLAVFLRTPESATLSGPLGWLTRSLGLDIFPTAMLGRRGILELKASALVLLVVFCFDFGAWTLLFNTILHSQILAFDRKTALAAVAGFLFAAMVVLYERQFLTSDISLGWRRLAWPTLIRFLVIFSSALVTAQPVELLFFHEPVLARMHQEGIRLQVTTRGKQLDEIDQLLQQQRADLERLPADLRQQQEGVDLAAARNELEAAETERDTQERQLERASQQLTAARQKEAEASSRRDAARREWEHATITAGAAGAMSVQRARQKYEQAEETLRKAASSIQYWRNEQAAAEARRDAAASEAQRVQPVVETRTEDFANRRADRERQLEARERQLRGEKERLKRWIRNLRELHVDEVKDGHLVVESTAKSSEVSPFGERVPFTYRFPRYHFFEQLRVISDLRDGTAPAWVGVSKDDAGRLAGDFALGGGEAPTSIYLYSYVVVYAIALVIPLMVFATKLLMTSELKLYYCAAAHAEVGDTKALSQADIARRISPRFQS